MTPLLLNLALGFVPWLILGASIAAGVEDDARHRRVFMLVYALWSFTLAGWNWMESNHAGWIAFWLIIAVLALIRSRR